MTRHWKFSQIISISIIGLIMIAAIAGVIGVDNSLMSEGVDPAAVAVQGEN